MHYRCTSCSTTEGRGFLPGASCGVLIFAQIGFAGAVMLAAIPNVFFDGLGWWWLLAAPTVLVLALSAAFLLNMILACLEWLAFCLRRCPECGARRWSFGFTQGFGL